jgi:hypothetical protein
VTRRSLSIATNYEGSPYALAGCLQDGLDWSELLGSKMYRAEVLLGADATRANVLPALTELVAATRYGDRLVVTYSGHGTQVPDRSGDEPDRKDEAVCLDDFQATGVTGDDELHAILSRRSYGARIAVILDSCNSGTAPGPTPAPGSITSQAWSVGGHGSSTERVSSGPRHR